MELSPEDLRWAKPDRVPVGREQAGRRPVLEQRPVSQCRDDVGAGGAPDVCRSPVGQPRARGSSDFASSQFVKDGGDFGEWDFSGGGWEWARVQVMDGEGVDTETGALVILRDYIP